MGYESMGISRKSMGFLNAEEASEKHTYQHCFMLNHRAPV